MPAQESSAVCGARRRAPCLERLRSGNYVASPAFVERKEGARPLAGMGMEVGACMDALGHGGPWTTLTSGKRSLLTLA